MSQARIADRAAELGYTLGKGAISRYFNGKHGESPSRQTLEAFAATLEVSVSDLEEAATFTGREPFTPDPSSDRLTAPQRAAVNEVIRQLAEANTRAGDGDVEATSKSRAAGSAAPVPQDDVGEVAEFRPRQLPAHLHAAYDTGDETMKQRLDRESEERDSGSQDPDDYS